MNTGTFIAYTLDWAQELASFCSIKIDNSFMTDALPNTVPKIIKLTTRQIKYQSGNIERLVEDNYYKTEVVNDHSSNP